MAMASLASGGDSVTVLDATYEQSASSNLQVQEAESGVGLTFKIFSMKHKFSKQAIKFLLPDSLDKKAKYSLPTLLYNERKALLFFFFHFVATMVTFQHFFYKKFRLQEEKVPEAAPNYWLKRLVPPFEFGAMHAILLQMVLLPLSMARHTISVLSETHLAAFIPFERTVGMHIHMGYTMCIIVFGSSLVFFFFFGHLCREQHAGLEPTPNGVFTFCEKFESEIFRTGLGILAGIILLATSSFLRNRIPYEIFYYGHHVVFAIFTLAIAHTMDQKARDHGQERSQSFKWFTATLTLYIADRLFMGFNMRSLPVVEWSALGDRMQEDKRFVIVRLQKPLSFTFNPGQYVSLMIQELDFTWHPFSVGSAPNERTLDFYIEVYGNNTWTSKLWDLVDQNPKNPKVAGKLNLEVKVMGPYGVAISDYSSFRHIMTIGTGTGVVRMLSLMKSVYLQLMQINAETHHDCTSVMTELTRDFTAEQQASSSSILKVLRKVILRPPTVFANDKRHVMASFIQLKYRLWQFHKHGLGSATFKGLERKKKEEERQVLWRLLALIPPILELALALLTISWRGDMDGYESISEMHDGLVAGTICMTVFFFFFWLQTPMSSFMWWVDL
eukprot:gene26210-32117_t